MSSLQFNKIYIFAVGEKRARVFDFQPGVNIITSSAEDGNKVGKSILLKSLYHTMGADSIFDDTWDAKNKIFILHITIDGISYQIYRYDRLFKIFKNDSLLFITEKREELSQFYLETFGFGIKLPNRQEDKLELTPPVYAFLLNYIDQDKMDGTTFSSFSGLGQYTNFKEDLLCAHLGAFDEDYYNLKKEEEKQRASEAEHNKQREMLASMIEKIKTDIVDVDYSSDIKALNQELDTNRAEYSDIISRLNRIKDKLIQARNQKEDLQAELSELEKSKALIAKNVKSINQHVCPLCSSDIQDNTHLRSSEYNTLEDLLLLTNQLQMELRKVSRHIDEQNTRYKMQLEVLNNYKKKIKSMTRNVDDIITHQGAVEIRDKFVGELGSVEIEIARIQSSLSDIHKKLKKYNDIKKNINSKYYEYMLQDKVRFELEEIAEKRIENITSTYKAQGSNRGIATAIWHYNLLKLKERFNPDAVKLPLVLDSPTDVELDENKENVFWKYMVEQVPVDTQLIISSLGFDKNSNPVSASIDNLIIIDTPKYHLLRQEDYEKYRDYLVSFNSASVEEL